MATPMADNTLYPVPPVAPDYAPPVVDVEPRQAYVATNRTTKFTATVHDAAGDEITDAALVWSVNGVRGGDPSTGQVADDGTFLAPFHTPNPSAYEVTARYEGAVGRAVVSIVASQDQMPSQPDQAGTAPTAGAAAAPATTTTAGGNP